MSEKSEQIIEHLFRTEYGKLVSILTHIFGTSYIQLAEDIVQDTLIAALNHWSVDGIPENPTGWLVQVAKRKVLNELKRKKIILQHHNAGNVPEYSDSDIDAVFLENEIEDSQLRMIFTCCHPSLNTESQVALTLKTLCGFGVKEVANALLTSESTINKRLYRAKKTIRETNLPFTIPQGKELETRLNTVILTLYLLFNEGYNSSSSDSIIKKELCLEALRLAKLLAEHFEENGELCALISLMCFHIARFEGRLDDRSAIILFEDQDRSLWNKELISKGMQYLKMSMKSTSLSSYHIEASIAGQHCMADSFENTNWLNIYDQYVLLKSVKPNPIIDLNLAIIQSKIDGLKTSLEMLNKLSQKEILNDYYLLPATQGIFNMKLENYSEAINFLETALSLNPSETESEFLEKKIRECKKLAPG
ncbi:MAG: sigma-70 family RNA polymerase sigma factor [Balneola sp.]